MWSDLTDEHLLANARYWARRGPLPADLLVELIRRGFDTTPYN